MPLFSIGERQIGTALAHIKPDHVARYRWAADQIAAHVPQKESSAWICDMGCGVGYGSHLLAESGNIVLAVDSDQETIDYARHHWNHEHIQYLAYPMQSLIADWGGNWRNEQGANQVAVALEFIEHVEGPQDILSRFPGRYLFASVPDQRGRPFSKKLFPFHYRHYTPDEFLELLDSTGWDVVERYQQLSVSIQPGWAYAGKSLLAVANRRKEQNT